MPIKIEEAIADWLIDDYKKPGLNRKRLEEEIYKIYVEKEYKGERVQVRTDNPRGVQFRSCIERLERLSVIEPIDKPGGPWFLHEESNYYLVSPYKEKPYAEIVCSLYPYGFIAYITAMSWYGITDRIPKKIYYTSPSRSLWKKKSTEDITERIGHYAKSLDFVPFFPKEMRVSGYYLVAMETKNYIEPLEAEGGVRVTEIGQLFIDMTRRPEFSGGESHVIEVYSEYGYAFRKKIIKQLMKVGTSIDKARVCFLLENVCGVSSSQIEEWKLEQSGKRGGSRKFSHRNGFSSCYSSSWGISLNVKEIEGYGIRD